VEGLQIMRLPVRSRTGNVVLAIVGGFYALSALSILLWFIFEVWNAATMFDRALQFALAVAVACGLWIVLKALENLGLRQQPRQWHPHKVRS
jgi:hypothetical protein